MKFRHLFKSNVTSLTAWRSTFKNFRNAGLYFAGSILQSILALVAQPIYSVHLSAADFGIISYFEAVKSAFAPFFILSLSTVYLTRYFKQSEEQNKRLLFNLVFYTFLYNTILIFIGYGIIYLYFKSTSVNVPLLPYGWIVLTLLLFDNLKSAVLINLRIRKKAVVFFMYSAAISLLNFLLGIFLVVQLEGGPAGRMVAPLLSIFVLLPLTYRILKKYTAWHFDLGIFVGAVRTAIPLVLAALLYVPITSIDIFFLEKKNDLSEMGLYSIGITIAGYVQLGYIALNMAFEPDVFKSVAEKNYRRLATIFGLIFLPYLFLVLTFMYFSSPIINILTAGRYTEASYYANVALISVFFLSLYFFFDKLIIAMDVPKINLYLNLCGAIASIIIMYYAVRIYGFTGAIYGKVAVSLALVLFSCFVAVRMLRNHAKKIVI